MFPDDGRTISGNVISLNLLVHNVIHLLKYLEKDLHYAVRELVVTLIKVAKTTHFRGGSRAAATSKMECFVIIVNGWKPLTIITKHSILDVAAALDPPLHLFL